MRAHFIFSKFVKYRLKYFRAKKYRRYFCRIREWTSIFRESSERSEPENSWKQPKYMATFHVTYWFELDLPKYSWTWSLFLFSLPHLARSHEQECTTSDSEHYSHPALSPFQLRIRTAKSKLISLLIVSSCHRKLHFTSYLVQFVLVLSHFTQWQMADQFSTKEWPSQCAPTWSTTVCSRTKFHCRTALSPSVSVNFCTSQK